MMCHMIYCIRLFHNIFVNNQVLTAEMPINEINLFCVFASAAAASGLYSKAFILVLSSLSFFLFICVK